MKRSTTILLGVAALALVAQAIRPTRNLGEVAGPNHISTKTPVPAEVEAILQRACYDCHSNATRYPWYANIQPVGWWLAEMVRGREMPLGSYTWVHRDAKLSDAEIKLLGDWAINTRRTLGAALSAPGK